MTTGQVMTDQRVIEGRVIREPAKPRRCWCIFCQRRTLFPTLHFIAHVIEIIKGYPGEV